MSAEAKLQSTPGAPSEAAPWARDRSAEEAEIVVLPQRSAAGLELNADLAAHWEMWSGQIGRAVLPHMEALANSLPNFQSAMICTADGLNLCALGIDEVHVNRMSAMASSLHSIAEASCKTLDEGTDGPMASMSLAHGDRQTVLFAVHGLIVGSILLWVTSEDKLGAILMRSKVTAQQIRDVLANE